MNQHFPTLLAVAVVSLAAGCSDPADKVHKSSASDPQKTASGTSSGSKEYVVRAESTIGFVGSKVTGSHNGGFKNFAGKIHVAGGKIVGPTEIKIAMQSTWADDGRLATHLKSPDFFNAATYPVTTFTATKIEPSGTQHNVTGNLELHGVAKSISFPATIGIADEAVTVKTEFAINRKDFNINYPGKPNDLIRDNVVIKLDLKATPGAARAEDQLVN